MDLVLAHGSLLHPFEGMTQFGTDWFYVAGPLLLIVAGAAGLHRMGADPGRVRDRHLLRIGSGAARLTGMPAWAATSLLTLIGFLPVLAMGFFFDVAWHVDLGRDEYLLSPPHVLLMLGVGPGFAGAGLVGLLIATATRADVTWRREVRGRTWHVPVSSAFLVLATAVATVGWGVDELWHMVYGLDVTMWSPTHMAMIGSAFLLGAAAYVLLGEAGDLDHLTVVGRGLVIIIAGAALEAFSSVQLEFDLGVPQWQLLYQPLLIVLAAGLALPAARALLGRGGALTAVGVFLVLRLALAGAVDQVWHFTAPRFPLYLAAAIAVEVAAARVRDRRWLATAQGIGIATVGLAGEWAWSQLDGTYLGLPHAWSAALLPGLLWALPLGIAASVLGLALGRVGSGRPNGIGALLPLVHARSWAPTAVAVGALGLIGVVLALPSARVAPEGEVTVATARVGSGLVDVIVTPSAPTRFDTAERFEVFSWQGGGDPAQTRGQGRVNVPLERQADGSWRTTAAVPVGGTWKTMVVVNDGPAFGAAPVFLPADAEYGLEEVPVVASRTAPMRSAQEVLMREVHGGSSPWVHVLAYVVLAAGLLAELVVLVRGVARMDGGRPDRSAAGGRRRAAVGA